MFRTIETSKKQVFNISSVNENLHFLLFSDKISEKLRIFVTKSISSFSRKMEFSLNSVLFSLNSHWYWEFSLILQRVRFYFQFWVHFDLFETVIFQLSQLSFETRVSIRFFFTYVFSCIFETTVQLHLRTPSSFVDASNFSYWNPQQKRGVLKCNCTYLKCRISRKVL